MYQTKNLGLNITEINKDSLQAFNFDTDLGDNFKAIDEKTLSHRNITNCLLEVPQDIKLELVDGVLTLKEGSKVYVPNGLNIFDEIIIQDDLQLVGIDTVAQSVFIYYRAGNLVRGSITITTSGTTPPETGIFYNTDDNTIKYYLDGNLQGEGYSLPLGIVTMAGNGTTDIYSIDQVFNGFGYIGSTVFALPGVKGLIPNSRNEDKSLKNKEFTISKVITKTFEEETLDAVIGLTENDTIGRIYLRNYSFDFENNYCFDKGVNTSWEFCVAATLSLNKGVVSNLKPKLPFMAVDYNDYQTKITELETKIATLQAAVEALQG